MNDVEIFRFPATGQTVRTVLRDCQPWFVAADVAAVLKLGNPRSSVALLDDDEKAVHTVDTPGGPQAMTIANEAGLYSLILRSRKPEAKTFKRWITHEVLPAIRQTGGYGLAELSPEELLLRQAQRLVEQARRVREHDRQLAVVSARVDGIEQRTGWYTALGFARKEHLRTDHQYLNRLGRAAAQILRASGGSPARVVNQAFGEVNSYPEWCLSEAAGGMT